ncbi:MAG: hypothetical protein WDO13_19110 [Verrucomicrobiota bacterium]
MGETSNLAAGHGPLVNRSELVTRIMPLESGATSQLSGIVSKPEREAVVRALGRLRRHAHLEPAHRPRRAGGPLSAHGHRGRHDRGAGAVRRAGRAPLLLHVAIDRYTGKVIDEQLEVVNDN